LGAARSQLGRRAKASVLGPPEFAAKPSSQASTQSHPSPISLIPTSTASAPRLRPCRRPHSSTASVDELSIGRDYPRPTISSPVLGHPSTQGASASFTVETVPFAHENKPRATSAPYHRPSETPSTIDARRVKQEPS